jgi:alcohol dehydrogenase class IV
MELVARHLVRAVDDLSAIEAWGRKFLASTFAGIGFRNAGVQLPHRI